MDAPLSGVAGVVVADGALRPDRLVVVGVELGHELARASARRLTAHELERLAAVRLVVQEEPEVTLAERGVAGGVEDEGVPEDVQSRRRRDRLVGHVLERDEAQELNAQVPGHLLGDALAINEAFDHLLQPLFLESGDAVHQVINLAAADQAERPGFGHRQTCVLHDVSPVLLSSFRMNKDA